jgi:hypothetical protein
MANNNNNEEFGEYIIPIITLGRRCTWHMFPTADHQHRHQGEHLPQPQSTRRSFNIRKSNQRGHLPAACDFIPRHIPSSFLDTQPTAIMGALGNLIPRIILFTIVGAFAFVGYQVRYQSESSCSKATH